MVVNELEEQEEPRVVKRAKLEHGDEDKSGFSSYDDVDIRTHPAYDQVMLDVNRCAGRLEHLKRVYFHKKSNISDTSLIEETSDDESNNDSDQLSSHTTNTNFQDAIDQRNLQEKLAKLIVILLIEYPDLHYYQGFHDVCLSYMTIHGPEEALSKMRSLVKSHFGIYMKPTMEETKQFLSLIPVLIGSRSPRLEEFLYKAEIGTIFALSWVITWFSHVLPNERDVVEIFEFLEHQDVHMILYLSAEIILSKEAEILELEPEMSTVHHFLSQVPRKEKLQFSSLIKKAQQYISDYPPELLKKRHTRIIRSRTGLQNRNFFSAITNYVVPAIGTIVSSNKRTVIVVMILASAIALQFDRWNR